MSAEVELEDREDIVQLVAEGYTVHIDITARPYPDAAEDDPPHPYHTVTVKDGDNVVSTGEGWLFFEAMLTAYQATPEKVTP